jgi:hypothetical protein
MTTQDSHNMYLNPFNDFGFIRLFANPKHPEPRRDFITHALAPFGIDQILETELLDRELTPYAREICGGAVCQNSPKHLQNSPPTQLFPPPVSN